MLKPIILFREDRDNEEEYLIAKKYFDVVINRNAIPENSYVLGRYSTLPYYEELEKDILIKNSILSDSLSQFNYIANFEYYKDIEQYTFKTYFEGHLIPDDSGPLVIKGVINSKKSQWINKMYAANKKEAILKSIELRNDSLIGQQDIIFRKYEKLVTYEIFLNGLPCTEEYRFFFYKTDELCHGYYWSQADNIEDRICAKEGIELAHKISDIVSKRANFFVVDVAKKETGEWVVVELNTGSMSGISLCNPEELYKNLKASLEKETL